MAALVEEVKTEWSKWSKRKGNQFRCFHWQKGYGAFSIGQSQVPTVLRYLARQKEHHRRVTFQDEYREFLKRYQVPYDKNNRKERKGIRKGRRDRRRLVSVGLERIHQLADAWHFNFKLKEKSLSTPRTPLASPHAPICENSSKITEFPNGLSSHC